MAGFNLFNTTTSAPTVPSAPFGASSTANTSLSFGGNTSQQNLSFGAPSSTQQSNRSFGAAGAGNVTLGTPSAQQNLAFGTPTAQSTLGFGTPTAQSNVSYGGQSQNTTFGVAANQGNMSFGTPAPNTVAFGAAPGQGNLTFGTPNMQQSNLSFGAVSTQPTNVAFGTPTMQQQQSNVTFGTVAPQANPTFAAPTAQSNLSFGTAGIVQPTFGAAASTAQPTFGAAAGTAQPTFGAAASTAQPTFGAVTGTVQPTFGSTVGTSQPAFGAVNTAQPTFGAVASTPQSTFGTAATIAQPTFGTLKPQPLGIPGAGLFANTPQSTLSFGASTLKTTITSTPLSTANTATAKPSFGSFAASTSSAPVGLSFGGTPVTAQSATPTPTSLFGVVGTPQATVTATSATPTLSFGLSGASAFGSAAPSLATTTSTSQPASAPSGLGGISFGAITSAAPTLSFSGLGATTTQSAATTVPGLLGTSFGLPTCTTAAPTGGLFSWQKTGTETPTTSTTSVSLGLGGIDHTAVTTTQSSTNTVVSAKEQTLPNEIQQTVVAFKDYVKTQKNLSSEVARTSAEPLTKLTQQIGALNNLILTLGSILSQQKFTAEKIKLETIKSLNDYELAQKIKDSPVASEERMHAIRKYFTEKISAFEESTKTLHEKIEYVYQHVITLPQENSLSAEALKLIVKKLHDSFVVIGARAHKLHNDMQLLKVQYLTLRNQYVKDNSSINFSLNRELQLPFANASRMGPNPSEVSLEGPNPFSRSAGGSFSALLMSSENRNYPITSTQSKEWNVGGLNVSKPFGFFDGSSNLGYEQSPSSLTGNQQFNLQKPPLGNKRGKR